VPGYDGWMDRRTDESTDTSTMAKMHKPLHAVMRKNEKEYMN